jgi:hypothetical protein
MSKYLNEKERHIWLARLNSESLGEGGLGIDWRGVRHALADWKTYVMAVCFMLPCVFLPLPLRELIMPS